MHSVHTTSSFEKPIQTNKKFNKSCFPFVHVGEERREGEREKKKRGHNTERREEEKNLAVRHSCFFPPSSSFSSSLESCVRVSPFSLSLSLEWIAKDWHAFEEARVVGHVGSCRLLAPILPFPKLMLKSAQNRSCSQYLLSNGRPIPALP
jgi:hypothetical protein